jgi:plasmid stabilization system protein ParE
LKVAFTSAARRDRREAEAWYRRRSRAAVDSFIQELDAALRFIGEYPEGAPVFAPGSRGKTLAHFPFSVVYDIKPDRIVVMAIVDERREPSSYEDHFR